MDILNALAIAGLSIDADGSRLIVRPKHLLTDELRSLIRHNKPILLASLSKMPLETHDQVNEFIEADGLCLADAQALAAVAIQPRSPSEWLAMIHRLDALIAQYCESHKLSDAARKKILTARHSQPLASIPGALEWFKFALKEENNAE